MTTDPISPEQGSRPTRLALALVLLVLVTVFLFQVSNNVGQSRQASEARRSERARHLWRELVREERLKEVDYVDRLAEYHIARSEGRDAGMTEILQEQ
jgi:hypothetical protein